MTKKKKSFGLKRKSDEADQRSSDHKEPNVPEEGSKGLNRRNFLGLAGAAAATPLLVNPLSAATDSEPTLEEPEAPATATSPVADPACAKETWDEPWEWNVSKWPGETLHLNVIEHQTPSTIVGLGNPNAALFSYNGATPGPTIRMKGDETLRVKLFNHLGLNQGYTPIGLDTDPAYYITKITGQDCDGPITTKLGFPCDFKKDGSVDPKCTTYKYKKDWELGEHVNGIHAIHTTNLHTHGLHVRPGLNVDGTHSDNIYLRVIPQADLEKRETDPNYNGDLLLEGEQAGEASYEFRLGQNNGKKIATHPPGTHWYHPHSHGSTNMEVASGMAGFLIVEGDVDEAINNYMTCDKDSNPTLRTGANGYRERLMMIQRVLVPSVDKDAKRIGLKKGATPTTNGSPGPDVIVMNPGDVERWRVLNGSVDGKGYIRFMVLEGQWSTGAGKGLKTKTGQKRPTKAKGWLAKKLRDMKQLIYHAPDGSSYLPTTQDIEDSKQQLYQLARDGVTLVKDGPDGPKYFVKDLKNDNKNPLYQDYSNLGDCYKDAETLKACYNLSNELYMAPANRADFFFQAPELNAGESYKVYTVIGKGTAIHTENEERTIQMYAKYSKNKYMKNGNLPEYMQQPFNGLSIPGDTIVAYIVVRQRTEVENEAIIGRDKPTKPFSFEGLMKAVSDVKVPDYLHPITQEDVKVKEHDPDQDKNGGANLGKYRTRQVTYSGWGAATWPIFDPEKVVKYDDSKDILGSVPPNLIWKPSDFAGLSMAPTTNGTVVAPTTTKTMAIDGKKFNPDDPDAPRPILNTSEEWVVYNQSISLFGEFPDNPSGDIPGAQAFDIDHRIGYPITRADAASRKYSITTRGIDHPFHIHTNPFWLMRVEVPDENGNLVNILPEPIWQDVMWIPRNGGRIVFRARFPDFVGKMVNHCHILQHEDNGMMQEVLITPSVKNGNYVPSDKISDPSMSSETVSGLGTSYKPETPQEAYKRSSHVMDMNHMNSPDLPLAYEYPAKNGAFEAPTPPPKK